MTNIQIRYMSEEAFEALRFSPRGLPAQSAYYVGKKGEGQFGYTDDGEGVFWYETAAEMKAQHC